ncbi:MAG: heme exporter protein CcmD [Phenylobacterium sp.]|uniref:heme exporter protein CcmD n=1 Tax=Phenylobacterium sp. TaxID=1871053 RepID=UPI0027337D1F|nr:heme exporter protein CcmD [Phenylobacterium sp.]MDP3173007.1 heme exporter protein CcmD [Phenylobacterium sp.]
MLDLDPAPYAAYVWPAYAATALVFAAMIGLSLAHARRWRARAGGVRKDAPRDAT